MPFKDPEQKKRWRREYKAKNKEKHRQWELDYQSRLNCRPEAIAARAEAEEKKRAAQAEKSRRETMRDVEAAINEVRQRIMIRDGLKSCSTCKEIKPLNMFAKCRRSRPSTQCTSCESACVTAWTAQNIDKIPAYSKASYARAKLDPSKWAGLKIRDRIGKALKRHGTGVRITGSKMQYLGCTAGEAVEHLAVSMTDGMTWANHGEVWHIDHIIPVSSFDLKLDSERHKAFHYTNLQALTAEENMSKGAKMPDEMHAAWPVHVAGTIKGQI